MTERKLNPFQDDEEEFVNTIDSGREFATERQEQNARKTNTDVSDHAHLIRFDAYFRVNEYAIHSNIWIFVYRNCQIILFLLDVG